MFRISTLLLTLLTIQAVASAEPMYAYITDFAVSPKTASPRYLIQGDTKANVRVVDLSRVDKTFASVVVLEFGLGQNGAYHTIHNIGWLNHDEHED